MKKFNYYSIVSLLALIFIGLTHEAVSEQYTTRGKEFWFGFMSNTVNVSPEITVYISSNKTTSGYIEVPLQDYKRTFTVAANSTVSIRIPTNLGMAEFSEEPEDKAIHIVSNDVVTVYALNYAEHTSDAAIILPVQTLGRDYYVQSYNILFQSLILIVPVGNKTKVEITPTQTTDDYKPAGKSFSVTLNKGEVYQIKSLEGGDLSGTRVRVISGDSIAVFGGADCSYVGNCGLACNHLFDQMYPVRDAGMRDFITVPYKTRTGDYFRIIAYFDSTSVSINGNVVTKLQSGKYHDVLLYNPSWITSDKPISIGQYSRSWSCDGVVSSDPFYINLSSSEMAIDTITFNCFPSYIIENYYVNIITQTESVNSIVFDGNNISNQFKPVPAKPEYSYAQVTTSSGDHTLASSGGVIAYIYAYGERESYGYSAGGNVFGNFTLMDCPTPTNSYNTGDTITYPISIKKVPFIQTAGTHKYSTRLKFNENVLIPVLDSTMTYNNDGVLIINSSNRDLQLPATLKELKFKAMLGDSECTTIEIDSLGWDDYVFEAKARCEVCITLCEAHGKRLVLSTDTLELSAIIPNPVIDEARLDYVLIEEGPTELVLVDILGNTAGVLFSGIAKPGAYSANIRVTSLQPGVYYCVLRTPSGKIVRKISVCH